MEQEVKIKCVAYPIALAIFSVATWRRPLSEAAFSILLRFEIRYCESPGEVNFAPLA